MYSFHLHQRIILMMVVMILFSGNSLYSFQPEPDLFPAPTPRQKYFGLSLSQNFAFRNYTENYFYDSDEIRKLQNEFIPSISFGLHLEKALSDLPYSSSLKFKLLYEKFTSKLGKTSYFYDISTRDVKDSLQFKNEHAVTQFSFQAAFFQRLFSTNLSFLLGGTFAYVHHDLNKEYYELNSIKDTALFTSNGPSPYYSFTEDYSKYMVKDFDRAPDARFTLNIGLQYDFHFEQIKVVPFIMYNHDFISRNQNYTLYSFQTGFDISFPIR